MAATRRRRHLGVKSSTLVQAVCNTINLALNLTMNEAVMSSTVPSDANATGSMHETQPRFRRLDGKPLNKSELDRRRLILSIESVCYYPVRNGGACCAILLDTHFELQQGDLLSLATVPLSALPPAPTGEAIETSQDATKINITGRYPATTQWVEVKRQTGTKDILVTPSVQFNAGAAGGGISSLGVNRHQSDNRSYKISLDSKQEAIDSQPVSLHWKFNDPNPSGVFYPPSMKLLVLVEKPTPNPVQFCFRLKLDFQMHVDLHSNWQQCMDGVRRFVGRSLVHEGWFFKIGGRYNPQAAKEALKDARDRHPNPPTIIGLNAAARPWMDAEQQINSYAQMPAGIIPS